MQKYISYIVVVVVSLLTFLVSFFKNRANKLKEKLDETNKKLNIKKVGLDILNEYSTKKDEIVKEGQKNEEENNNNNIVDLFHNFNNEL